MRNENARTPFLFCVVSLGLCSPFPPLSCSTCLGFGAALKHASDLCRHSIPDLSHTTNRHNTHFSENKILLSCSLQTWFDLFLSPAARSHSTVSHDTLLNDVQCCFCFHPVIFSCVEAVIVFSLCLFHLTCVCVCVCLRGPPH